MDENATRLLRRIRWITAFFIFALFISGATAIPLQTELDFLGRFFSSSGAGDSALAGWLFRVRDGLRETNAHYPFIAYGTDWLAFGHFAIAITFIGAWKDPVRNVWIFNFGLIACLLIVPYAFIMGGVRGIPIYWRLIDCSFGVFGLIPLWICRRACAQLEAHSLSTLN